MEFTIGETVIQIIKGDITEQDTDVIVNAANRNLMGGGGVDGAIHRKGGPSILKDCQRIREKEWPGGLPTGRAVITTGGNLRAKHVVHTVGPVWRGGNHKEQEQLAHVYENSLRLVVTNGLKSVAFPSISTGAYRYPVKEAAKVALKSIVGFLEKESKLREIRLVLFSHGDLEIYQNVAKEFVASTRAFT